MRPANMIRIRTLRFIGNSPQTDLRDGLSAESLIELQ